MKIIYSNRNPGNLLCQRYEERAKTKKMEKGKIKLLLSDQNF